MCVTPYKTKQQLFGFGRTPSYTLLERHLHARHGFTKPLPLWAGAVLILHTPDGRNAFLLGSCHKAAKLKEENSQNSGFFPTRPVTSTYGDKLPG